MAVFIKTFDTGTPTGSDLYSSVDTFIQDFKYGLNERHTLEHYALDDATTGANNSSNAWAQGRHRPGNTSCMYYCTTAQLAALTGMMAGAVAFDYSLKIPYVYSGTAWVPMFGYMGGTDITSLYITSALKLTNFVISDWTNAFDGSTATVTDTSASALTSRYIYWDLGATFSGMFLACFDMLSKTAGSKAYVYGAYALDSDSCNLILKDDDVGDTIQATAAVMDNTVANSVKYVLYFPYYGRYIGLKTTNLARCAFRKFQCWGLAV